MAIQPEKIKIRDGRVVETIVGGTKYFTAMDFPSFDGDYVLIEYAQEQIGKLFNELEEKT